MKKIVFIISFTVFFGYEGFAQGKIRYGVNGALTYSSYKGNPYMENFDAGFDFLAGVTFEYQIKEKLSLVAAINYDRKLASEELYTEIISPDDPSFYGDIKIKFKTQFISLPILVKYDFGPHNSFYINGGPFVSCVLKSVLSNDYDNSTIEGSVKGLDYGLVFGLGKTFKLKSNNEITIEVRENLGLADISAGNRAIKTNSLNLVCGYSFDFK